jgi:hypothetical protein
MLDSVQTEKGQTGEDQSQEHAMILFDIKGIVRKEFILAGQNSEFHIPL